MNKKNLTDEELLGHACAGDEEAFAELFDRYDSRLKGRLTWKFRDEVLAEEVIQETWIKVWNACGKFSANGPGSFSKFLNTVAKRAYIDRLRAEQARGRGNFVSLNCNDSGVDFIPEAQSADALIEMKDASHISNEDDRRRLLEWGLSALPNEQQEAIFRYLQGDSVKTIAQDLGEHQEAIKSRIRYGVAALKKWMQGYIDHD